jgi:hypothetical protein
MPVGGPDGKRHEWGYLQVLPNIAYHNSVNLPDYPW